MSILLHFNPHSLEVGFAILRMLIGCISVALSTIGGLFSSRSMIG